MSAKGCSPDNAAAEGFFGRLKNELFYGRDWRGVGYEEFRERLAAYLTHYNVLLQCLFDRFGSVFP